MVNRSRYLFEVKLSKSSSQVRIGWRKVSPRVGLAGRQSEFHTPHRPVLT